VNICRKLGLSAPHPRRIKVVIAFDFNDPNQRGLLDAATMYLETAVPEAKSPIWTTEATVSMLFTTV
jgi:hypothetical protein